jgi:hypothetical protein
MANDVIPFPVRPEPERSRPTGKKYSRVVVTIGPTRYAFEFSSSVMKVNPEDAPVMPIEQRKPIKVAGRKAKVKGST